MIATKRSPRNFSIITGHLSYYYESIFTKINCKMDLGEKFCEHKKAKTVEIVFASKIYLAK